MILPPLVFINSRRNGISQSILDHRPNYLARVHQLEGIVDLIQWQHFGDHFVDLDLAVEVAVHVAGQLRAAFDAAECRAAPDATGNQLERTGRYFLTGTRDTDDNRFAPTLVTTLQRRAHHMNVADAFERVVDAAVRQVDDDLLDGLVVVFRIDIVGCAERLGHGPFARVEIDGDDARGLGHHRTLHDRQADTAKTEYGNRRTRRDFRGIQYRADTGRDAAAEQADLVERRFGVDLRHRNLRQHGVFGKCAGAHVVQDGLALEGKSRGTVRHHALALGYADSLTQISLAGQAELAGSAFGGVQRNHVIAGFDAGDAGTDFLHDAAAFVTQYHREQPLRIGPGECERIGMAHARCDDAYQDLACLRSGQIDFFDAQWFIGFPGNSRSRLH